MWFQLEPVLRTYLKKAKICSLLWIFTYANIFKSTLTLNQIDSAVYTSPLSPVIENLVCHHKIFRFKDNLLVNIIETRK